MNRKQPFIWVKLFFMFFLTQMTLEAQEPVLLDSKMKPGISNDLRIEELKVRWKKAALENCPGVPCVTTAVPGAPTGLIVSAGNASANVAFTAPTNNGGSAITVYTVTSNPGNITATGTTSTSPINVTGLTNGTAYTFTVVATNAVGNSVASAASTAVTPAVQVCPTLLVTDGDGNPYNTINIGTQCWTKENLKATKYNDGITIIPDETANAGWGMLSTGARTEYIAAGVTGYVSTYGYLYNWYAAAGIISAGGISTKNICPSGWHVPTDADWTTLIQYLDNMATGSLPNSGNQSISASIKLKATTLWNSLLNTNNSSGFSALPGGYRDRTGSIFGDIGDHAYFWTTTVNNYNSLNNHAWNRDLYDNLIVYRTFYPMTVGFSIRCLKD